MSVDACGSGPGERSGNCTVHLSFSQPSRFLQASLREYALARLAGSAAGEDALDRRDHGGPAEVGALVLEQGGEVVALERVDQSDDLVRLQVVVVLERRAGAVGGRGGARPAVGLVRVRLVGRAAGVAALRRLVVSRSPLGLAGVPGGLPRARGAH